MNSFNFNRQSVGYSCKSSVGKYLGQESPPHKIQNRPNRLNSLLVCPIVEDIGSTIGLPHIKNTQFQCLKEQSAIRTQLKKYRNMMLFEKSLFRNHKENRENREKQDNREQINIMLKGTDPNDKFKIIQLNAKSLILSEQKLYNRSEQSTVVKLSGTTYTPSQNHSRKTSNVLMQVEVGNCLGQLSPMKILPSIRAWDNKQNSDRSN